MKITINVLFESRNILVVFYTRLCNIHVGSIRYTTSTHYDDDHDDDDHEGHTNRIIYSITASRG